MQQQAVFDLLRRFESRNVTYFAPDGTWPIVWDRASGEYVWDPGGKRYVDFTAAFGVAAAGHANPTVIRAACAQLGRLAHAMGDVHPHEMKARLARELSRITFERWTKTHTRTVAKTIFCNSGFEAVEASLKTAFLYTSKPEVIAFEGGYHGLGYGTLNTTHRAHFRSPFRKQLREFGHFLPFPRSQADLGGLVEQLTELFAHRPIGAVLVEPIQVRGGINVPPPRFLPLLRKVCDRAGAVLIFDEIYTGFGRTGTWFACEQFEAQPHLICLGKALTGGFPLSVCAGASDVMDAAWPPSSGEAIHTSTFLGHPVGCAMALAQIREIDRRRLVQRSARIGLELGKHLRRLEPPQGYSLECRGAGLLWGIEVRDHRCKPATRAVMQLIRRLLQRGFILLPEGEDGNVLSFSPPLTISTRSIERLTRTLAEELERINA